MSDFSDICYESSDGLALYARDYACRAAESRGTVLCLHGLSRNSADFHDLACELAEHYRVIAADQRGRGRSDWDPDPRNYAPPVYVQDMFRLLDELSLPEVTLVGTSMGGLMSFIMLATEPSRFSASVINDIGPEIDPTGLARIKGYVGKSRPVESWEDALEQAKEINAIAFPDFSEAQWWDFTRGLYSDEGGVPVLAYDPAISQPIEADEEAAAPPDLWPVFEAGTSRPMLLLRGESSDILADTCAREMASRHPQLTYIQVPNRGHAPTLTEKAALEAIQGFLDAL